MNPYRPRRRALWRAVGCLALLAAAGLIVSVALTITAGIATL